MSKTGRLAVAIAACLAIQARTFSQEPSPNGLLEENGAPHPQWDGGLDPGGPHAYDGDFHHPHAPGAFIQQPAADCPAFWEHRTGVFGEYLFLTARGADMHYATPVDAMFAPQRPIGPAAVVQPGYASGFRVGGSLALDCDKSLVASYTRFRSDATDAVALPGGAGFLRSEVVHPATQDVAADSLQARARYDIDFELVDVAYRQLLLGGCDFALNYVAGVRYGRLDQEFAGAHAIIGETLIHTDIDFHGVGPRLGLEGEKLFAHGFLAYGRGYANFLVGRFDAEFLQQNIFIGNQAIAGLSDRRIVSQLELELGVGWQTACGHFRVTAGYYLAGWFNTITTPSWVDAVRADNYRRISDTLTFDGLTARAELRF
jgi:hypothetical protein